MLEGVYQLVRQRERIDARGDSSFQRVIKPNLITSSRPLIITLVFMEWTQFLDHYVLLTYSRINKLCCFHFTGSVITKYIAYIFLRIATAIFSYFFMGVNAKRAYQRHNSYRSWQVCITEEKRVETNVPVNPGL